MVKVLKVIEFIDTGDKDNPGFAPIVGIPCNEVPKISCMPYGIDILYAPFIVKEVHRVELWISLPRRCNAEVQDPILVIVDCSHKGITDEHRYVKVRKAVFDLLSLNE